jgi:hypothetical protein
LCFGRMPPKGARAVEDTAAEEVPGRDVVENAGEGDDDSDSDSDSDASSDSDGSDDELEMPTESTMEHIMALERLITQTPTKYNAHVHLIKLLRTAKLKERLKNAREVFSDRFALNETQWRLWIADAVADTKGKKGKQREEAVLPLFEKAVLDVPGSVPIWLGFFELSMDQSWATDTRRALYERALESASGDFQMSHKLFAARRAFENARVSVDGDSEGVVHTRILGLWQRQLQIPHLDIGNTAKLADNWAKQTYGEKKENPFLTDHKTNAARALAVAQSDRRQGLWQEIETAAALPGGSDGGVDTGVDEKREKKQRLAIDRKANAVAAAVLKWLHQEESDFESSEDHIARDVKLSTLIAAYERAIASAPTDPTLWRRYTSRLERSASVRAATKAHERAVRHCPSDGETWASLFRWRRLEDDANGTFAADAAKDMVNKLTKVTDSTSPFSGAPEEYLVALEAAFTNYPLLPMEDAEKALASFAGLHWTDAKLTVPHAMVKARDDMLNAYIRENPERHDVNGEDAGDKLWSEYAAKRFANVAEAHVARARYENDANARVIFKEAFTRLDSLVSANELTGKGCKEKRVPGSEPGWVVLCRGWMDFEKEANKKQAALTPGYLKHFFYADKKAGVKLREWETAKAAKANSALDPDEAKRLRRLNDPNYVEKVARVAGKPVPDESKLGGKKRPPAENPTDESTAKRRRGDEKHETNDGIDAVGGVGANSRGQTAMDTNDPDRKDREQQADQISHPKLPDDPKERAEKYKELFPTRDATTAFCKNLPFQASQKELELFFEDERLKFVGSDGADGTVTARIVMDKTTGKPRGFAYVEFSHEAALQGAVAKDGQTFMGRPISIAVSLPPSGNKKNDFSQNTKTKSARPETTNPNIPTKRAPPRGLGFGGGMTPRAARSAVVASKEKLVEGEAPKSNAEFRAELLKGFKKSEEGL